MTDTSSALSELLKILSYSSEPSSSETAANKKATAAPSTSTLSSQKAPSSYVVPGFLQALFRQTELLLKKDTTYAQHPYFEEPATKKKESFLIKERILKKTYPLSSLALQETASAIEAHGILAQASDGLIYLKIAEDFLDKLYPYLEESPLIKFSSSLGAHIPVISAKELKTPFKELGETHLIRFVSCQKYLLDSIPGIDAVWVLNFHSPSLELLREKYRLPLKLHSQDFQAILAIEPSQKMKEKQEDDYFFRTNGATTAFV